MAHFTRELSDADWCVGRLVSQTTLRNIDEKTKKAVSGTGGTYSPTDPIGIAGAGIELQCGFQVGSGGLAQPDVGKNFIFGDDDYFRFATPYPKVTDDSSLQILGNFTLSREALPWMSTAGVTPALRTKRPGAKLRIPIRLANGGRLANVEVGYMIGSSHSVLPDSLPSARVIRIAPDGTMESYPFQTNTTAEPAGWVSVTRPALVADYYNGGALQTFNLTFDATNGPRIDTSLYGYAVEWWEEHGANAFSIAAGNIGNYLVHLRHTVNLPDLRPY